jgi:hypothetical protein
VTGLPDSDTTPDAITTAHAPFVIDPTTFEMIDTIEPLGNNSLAVLDGSLWTGGGHYGLLHRHDNVTG